MNSFMLSALKQRVTKSFFKFVKSLPIIRGKIAHEVDKNAKGIEDGFNKGVGKLPYVHKLPEKGLTGVSLLKDVGGSIAFIHYR